MQENRGNRMEETKKWIERKKIKNEGKDKENEKKIYEVNESMKYMMKGSTNERMVEKREKESRGIKGKDVE